jgi:hypothetical protein
LNFQPPFNVYAYKIVTNPRPQSFLCSNSAAESQGSAFDPVPKLSRPDGDVNLIFLESNYIMYLDQVDDPWFSAHIPGSYEGVPGYYSDALVGILGCVEQHQLCNPSSLSETCTPLSGIDELWDDANIASINLSDAQLAIGQRLQPVIASTGIWSQSWQDSDTLAKGSELLQSSISLALPPDQWVLEVNNWHARLMAMVQVMIVRYATGPDDIEDVQFIDPPDSDAEAWMCANQKIGRTDYTSFSVLGIAVILAVGSAIIYVNLGLESLVRCSERGARRTQGSEASGKSLEWTLHGTLQLQRMAFEGRDIGTWERLTDDVPVTARGEILDMVQIVELGSSHQ